MAVATYQAERRAYYFGRGALRRCPHESNDVAAYGLPCRRHRWTSPDADIVGGRHAHLSAMSAKYSAAGSAMAADTISVSTAPEERGATEIMSPPSPIPRRYAGRAMPIAER